MSSLYYTNYSVRILHIHNRLFLFPTDRLSLNCHLKIFLFRIAPANGLLFLDSNKVDFLLTHSYQVNAWGYGLLEVMRGDFWCNWIIIWGEPEPWGYGLSDVWVKKAFDCSKQKLRRSLLWSASVGVPRGSRIESKKLSTFTAWGSLEEAVIAVLMLFLYRGRSTWWFGHDQRHFETISKGGNTLRFWLDLTISFISLSPFSIAEACLV